MGYLYEVLIRRFSELSNETAGEHFTPREVIRLMVNLLCANGIWRATGAVPAGVDHKNLCASWRVERRSSFTSGGPGHDPGP
jgi:hypothetical protein